MSGRSPSIGPSQAVELHAIRDGLLYTTCGRSLLVGPNEWSLEFRGSLPSVTKLTRYGGPSLTTRPVQSILDRVVGRFSTYTVYPITDANILATSGRVLLISRDGGQHWEMQDRLPPSSPPFGVLKSGICHHDSTTYIGTYPMNRRDPPSLLKSTDGGRHWTSIELPDVRHVHSVQADPMSGDIWITTGDADAACNILRLENGELHRIGGGSQQWRAVELAFTQDAILWGMDCPYVKQKSICKLDRDEIGNSSPTIVGEVSESVFYSATIERDGDYWVAFSTAAETGIDSTAPDQPVYHNNTATVVTAAESSDYREWIELGRYSKRRVLADFLPPNLVHNANAYIHLGGLEDTFLINPINTANSHGRLERMSPLSPNIQDH